MAEEQKQPTAEAIPEPQQPAAEAIPEPQQAMESQVTSKTPATRPAKNPKRVAAGKRVAEKTRLAREEEKKVLAEAHAIIANNKQAKKETAPPAPAPEPETEPKPDAADSNGLTTTQLISIIGIGATLSSVMI